MGNFDDLIPKKVGAFDDLIPSKKESPSFVNKFGSGGIGYGAEAVKQGLGFSDVPHIAAKAVSGLAQGLPERIAKNPVKFALAGPQGASVAFQDDERGQLPFPQPRSEGGKMIGKSAELVTSSLPAGGFSKPISKMKFGSSGKFGQLSGDSQRAKELADSLMSGTEKARETVGKAQGDFINQNAAELVDEAQFQDLLKKLPPDLADELATHKDIVRQTVGQVDEAGFVMGPSSKQISPQITRVRGSKTNVVEPSFDESTGKYANEIVTPRKVLDNPEDIVALHQPGEGVNVRKITSISPKETYSLRSASGPGGKMTKGKEIISPTLKNAETIRGLIKGEVPARHFKPSLLDDQSKNLVEGLYDEVGKLMREGRPDLAEKMQNYAKVMEARAEILPQLKTKTGFTKTRPVMRMYGNNSEVTSQQALNRLAEYNPELKETANQVKKFGSGLERKKYFRGLGKKAAGGAATVFGAKKAWDFLS